jgi:drug/metabolite transporter (DMT)-like permease
MAVASGVRGGYRPRPVVPESAFHPSRRSIVLMLLSVVLFAANTLLVRGLALRQPAADGWLASLLRGVVGLVLVALLYGRGRGLKPASLLGNRLVVLRGIVGALGILAFYLTVVHLGAARGVVLNLTYPMWGTLIAAVWLKERVTRGALLWMVAGFAGLLMFLGRDGVRLELSRWDAVGLTGAVAAGWVVTIIRRLRHDETPATIYASQAFYGLLVSLPAAGTLRMVDGPTMAGLAAAGVLVAVAQLWMTEAYRQLPVSRGSSIQMLLPVVTAAGGMLVFGETFHGVELAGAALTMLATWRIARGGGKSRVIRKLGT